ncbi:MAG TPA: PDZ domain-containing protein, partial [Anaerolineales bacterium]|nr:PDZ domain-containing protein [Anaerolineales bacterium]
MRIYRLIPLSALWLSMLACSTVSTFSATPTPTAAPLPTLPPAPPTASPIDLQLQTLDVIDQVVTEAFVREDLDGVPWADEVAAVRAQVGAGLDAEGFDIAIHDLVDSFPNDAVQFLSRAERIELEANASTTYQGIGVYFGVRGAPEPRVVVLSVIPGSPAEAAGLEAHDAILAIDGAPIPADATREVMANRIRGAAGSAVTLSVRSPGAEPRDVVITRGEIAIVGHHDVARFAEMTFVDHHVAGDDQTGAGALRVVLGHQR